MTADSSMPASPFLRRAGSHFAKLAGLYALYVAWAFLHDYQASVSYLHRVALLFGGASFALALLVAPAVFAAAVHHFDLFGERAIETRKRDWTRLALLGLAACLAPEAGLPLSDYLLDIVAPDRVRGVVQPGADYASAGLFVPVAVGIFVMISGVAGAAVGHATELWDPVRSHAAKWLAFVALATLFCIPVLGVIDLVRFQGYPPILTTVVAPSLLPALATCLLVRSRGYGVLEVLGLDRRQADWLDAEALDRVLDVVVHEDEEGRPTIEEAIHDEAELKTAKFLRGLRRAMAPRLSVTSEEAEQIVANALAAAPAQTAPSPSGSRASRLRATVVRLRDATLRGLAWVGEYGLTWAVLAAGLVLFGWMADISPNLVAAAALGALGVVVRAYLSRQSEKPVPPGALPA